MKNLFLFIFIYSWQTITACDVCGGYFNTNPNFSKQQLMLVHRYKVLSGYNHYQQKSKFINQGAYRVMHPDPINNDSTEEVVDYTNKDYESFKTFDLKGRFTIKNKLEVLVNFGYQEIKTKYNGEKKINKGITDLQLLFGYRIIDENKAKIKHLLISGCGIKLPTGNYVKKINDTRLSLLNQNGTGSLDYMFYVNYRLQIKNMGLNTFTLFKLNTYNSLHEKIGNSFNKTLSVYYQYTKNNTMLFFSILTTYEYSKGIFKHKKLVNYTSTNVCLLGSSFDMVYKNLQFNLAYQFRVFERNAANNLGTAGRFITSLGYNF